MNWDQMQGNWKQIKGMLTKKWGKLTSDDLAMANGDRKILAGKIQEYYGLSKEEAHRQLDDLVERYRPEHPEVATEGAPVDSATLKIGMS